MSYHYLGQADDPLGAFLAKVDQLISELIAVRNQVEKTCGGDENCQNFIRTVDNVLDGAIPRLRQRVIDGEVDKAPDLERVLTSAIQASSDVVADWEEHYSSFWTGMRAEALALAKSTGVFAREVVAEAAGIPFWAVAIVAAGFLYLIGKAKP